VRRAVRLAAGSASDLHNDIEIMVLRHQLAVLKRQVGRPRLRRRDRLFMAAVSRVLPRPRWSWFVVSPQTLLRWHRELVRRKWTHRRNATGGRPPLADDVGELILRMGGENPRWGCVRIPGRAGQARDQGLGGVDPLAPASKQARSGSTAAGPDLGGVPAQPGRRDPGDRLLHRRVHLTQDPVRVLRDRASHQAGPHGGSHQEPNAAWVTQQGGTCPSTSPAAEPSGS
jgi:hypothetical protein